MFKNPLGLRAMLIVAFFGIALSFCAAVFWVINQQGKRAVVAETNETIEQRGNNAVHELEKLLNQTAGLTIATASLAKSLPLDEATFARYITKLNEDQSYPALEGFGIWPEPYAFDKNKERSGFYWARDGKDGFKRFEDDNDAEESNPYWIDEWYVIGRYAKPNTCVWTDPYIDTTNNVSMVTCTVGIHRDNRLFGVSQLDIRLDGLSKRVQEWQKLTGGYAFITGSDNRFIAFPSAEESLPLFKEVKDEKLKYSADASITIDELSKKEPSFEPIAKAMFEIDDKRNDAAIKTSNFSKTVSGMEKDSVDLDTAGATLRASVMADVFKDSEFTSSNLFKIVQIEHDAILNTSASAYVFHVPHTYWKYVVVKPTHEITNVANELVKNLAKYLIPLIFIMGLVSYLLANKMVFRPLIDISKKMQNVTNLLTEKDYNKLHEEQLKLQRDDEIGHLGNSIDGLLSRVVSNEEQLAEVNENLEHQVAERTQALVETLEQLKASQAKLVNSEKMAALGQMVAGVAHEVNTPLSYVQGNVSLTQQYIEQFDELIQAGQKLHEMIASGDTAATDDKVTDYINRVSDLSAQLHAEEISDDAKVILDDAMFGIGQISDLVSNLKDFARIDEAKMKQVDIHDCIESSLVIAKGNLSSVEVIKQFDAVTSVWCSPSQINQVLLNLFNNAAQAMQTMPDGRHAILTITTSETDQHVEISIEDNGAGMSSETVAKVFEPFYTTKGSGEGTGLGLAISRQIMEQHEGRLHATSELGEGSCFTLSLPTSAAPVTS